MNPADKVDPTRLIVMGTSTGGLDALLRILPRLPSTLPAPIVVVRHVGTHPTRLPELLARKTPHPVELVRDGSAPRPGTIYVAPADRHVLIEEGLLRLFRGPKEHHTRPAIDPLFRSAALDRGPRVIGVVLTGMLEDGSAGLRAIAACGGTTVVQDPSGADAPSMPIHAIAGTAVDHVVTLDAMPDLLTALAAPLSHVDAITPPAWLRIAHQVSKGISSMDELHSIGTPSHFSCPDCGGSLFEIADGPPVRFLCHTGHAFGMHSLIAAQESITETTLWESIRAVQEKIALLVRLADTETGNSQKSSDAANEEIQSLTAVAERLRALAESLPPSHGMAVESATDDGLVRKARISST
jgi:two-component system chemotaxis response regulator CheB